MSLAGAVPGILTKAMFARRMLNSSSSMKMPSVIASKVSSYSLLARTTFSNNCAFSIAIPICWSMITSKLTSQEVGGRPRLKTFMTPNSFPLALRGTLT